MVLNVLTNAKEDTEVVSFQILSQTSIWYCWYDWEY